MNSLNLAVLAERTIFSGISGGERALAAVLGQLRIHSPGEPVVLDMHGVEVIAASALRHLQQGLKNHAPTIGSVLVLANLSEDSFADADLVASATRQPFIVATLVNGKFDNATVCGALDEKVGQTLQLVIRAGEADAQTVRELSGDDGGATVWNNRLATLMSMGLLRERKVGKRKFFSPVLEGLAYGS